MTSYLDTRLNYIYIRAYGVHQRLYPYVIRAEIATAKEDKAPTNAIFKRDDGTWATIEDIKGPERERIAHIAGQIKRRANPIKRRIYGY